MVIPNSLKTKIYVAYALGNDSNNKMQYAEPVEVYAQVTDVKSFVLREDVGYVPDYDRLVIVPSGEISQFIDEHTLLWLNVEPNANKSNMDFKIERVGDIIDGNVTLYCNSLSSNNKSLYYEYNGKIFQAKVDLDNLTAFVPYNKYLPIKKDTKVWLTKPNDTTSTKNLIQLVDVVAMCKSRKFTFRKVNNG